MSPLKRHPKNPILTPREMPFPCYTVMNTGATWFEDKVLLILRVEYCDRETHFHIATSEDGIRFDIEPSPVELPLTRVETVYGEQHHFDARITRIDDTYYINYAIYLSRWGCCIATAITRDFKSFEVLPFTSEPSNRNAVLFPEKIGGHFARLDRPQDVNGNGEIWISYSPDLQFWGRHLPLDIPHRMWNKGKSGAGAVPIRTPKGWLEIYHATAATCSSLNYYLGAALLDLEDPSKVIAAPRSYVLAAEEVYECVGQTPNVVFTGGAVAIPDGTLNVYYGGADTRLCLAQTTVDDLVSFCLGG